MHQSKEGKDSWELDCVHAVPARSNKYFLDYYLFFMGKNGHRYQVKLERENFANDSGLWWREFSTEYGFAKVENTDLEELYINFARMVKTMRENGEIINEVALVGATTQYTVEDIKDIEKEMRNAGFTEHIEIDDYEALAKQYSELFGRHIPLKEPNIDLGVARVRLVKMSFAKYLPDWKVNYRGKKDSYLDVKVPDDL